MIIFQKFVTIDFIIVILISAAQYVISSYIKYVVLVRLELIAVYKILEIGRIRKLELENRIMLSFLGSGEIMYQIATRNLILFRPS